MRGECGSGSRPGRTVGCHQGPIPVRKLMGADTATPGRLVRDRRRAWAWMALVGFAGLVVVVAAVLVLSGDSLIGLVFTVVVCLLLGGAALWWGVHHTQGVEALAQPGLDRVGRCRSGDQSRRLRPVASRRYARHRGQRSPTGWPPGRRSPTPHWPPQGSAQPSPPARPWLLVNPRSGDGTAGRVGLVDGARVRGISVHELAPGDDPGDAGARGGGCWRRRGRCCRRRWVAGADCGGRRRARRAVCVRAGGHLATISPMILGSTGLTPWPASIRSAARSAASMSRWWATECS